MITFQKNSQGAVLKEMRQMKTPGYVLKTCSMALAAVLLAAGAFSPAIAAKKKISWMIVEWPPYVIQKGTFKNQGTVDQTVRYLMHRLPGYEHEIIYSSAKRLFIDMAKRENICSAAWLKNDEREEIARYSIAYAPAPTIMLVTVREKAGKFLSLCSKKNKISLEELLMNHQELKLGIISKRSYTNTLDSIITQHLDKDNIFTRTGGDLGHGLIQMLASGRIDYTIEYPHVVTYTNKEMVPDMAPYFIPISELDKQVLYGHVICSDSAFGKKVIKDVNAVLRKDIDKILGIIEKWFNPEAIELLETSGAYEYVRNQ